MRARQTDRQTDRQTYRDIITLIAMLHISNGSKVTTSFNCRPLGFFVHTACAEAWLYVTQPTVTHTRSALRVRSRDDTASTRTTTEMATTLSVVFTSGLDATLARQWTSSTRAPCVPVCVKIFSILKQLPGWLLITYTHWIKN